MFHNPSQHTSSKTTPPPTKSTSSHCCNSTISLKTPRPKPGLCFFPQKLNASCLLKQTMEKIILVSVAPYKYKRSKKCRQIRDTVCINNFLITIGESDTLMRLVNLKDHEVYELRNAYVYNQHLIYTTTSGEVFINEKCVAVGAAVSLKFENNKFIIVCDGRTTVRNAEMNVIANISHSKWVSSSHEKISVFYDKKTYYYTNTDVLLHTSDRRFVCWTNDTAVETDQSIIYHNDIGKYLQIFVPLTTVQQLNENRIQMLLDMAIVDAAMIYGYQIAAPIPVEFTPVDKWDAIMLSVGLGATDTTCMISGNMFTVPLQDDMRDKFMINGKVRASLNGVYITTMREAIAALYSKIWTLHNEAADIDISDIMVIDNVTYNGATLTLGQSDNAKKLTSVAQNIYKHGLIAFIDGVDIDAATSVFKNTQFKIATQNEFITEWAPYLELIKIPPLHSNGIVDCTECIRAAKLIKRIREDFKELDKHRNTELSAERFLQKLLK